MDNQSNPPPPPPAPDPSQKVPVITHDVSSYSREERKQLCIQLNTELHRVQAMIKTARIKAAKIKTPKIKAAKFKIKAVKIKPFKIEEGSQDQNVLLQKLIDECDNIFKKLRKYQHCKHLNQPVVVEGIVGKSIGFNEIASRFQKKCYKSPHQFLDDMRSACNHAMDYDKRDEVVKVASRILDRLQKEIKPILKGWKKLGAVDNEEIAMDVNAGFGEKSDNTDTVLVSTGDIGKISFACTDQRYSDLDLDNNEDDALWLN